MMSVDEALNPNDPMTSALRREAEEHSRKVRACMAPKGSLNLPEALEKKRWEYGITDGAFRAQPVFDRVYVWQVEMFEDSYRAEKGNLIAMPATAADREKRSAPRGVLVSAGLSALDQLESHGVQVGDMVSVLQLAPFFLPCDMVEGTMLYLMVLSAGDINGSEDLARRLKTGETTLQRVHYVDSVTGQDAQCSVYINRSGPAVVPQMAVMPADH